MKNLFNKLRMMISHPIGKRELMCKKNDFCDCSQDLEGMCLNCGDKRRMNLHCVKENGDESPNI